MTYGDTQKVAAEALGTALLLAIVVGSGVMAEQLAGDNTALALLANSIATGAGLYVLITIFGPISGAHFNPAVTLAFLLRKGINPPLACFFIAAQAGGAFVGVASAHAMFDLEIMQLSDTVRASSGHLIAETIATFGLVLTILLCVNHAPKHVAASVALYITSAYWFTSSTAFANPAVTIGRIFTDTFAGIRPDDAGTFIVAQLTGAVTAAACASLFRQRDARLEEGYSAAL